MHTTCSLAIHSLRLRNLKYPKRVSYGMGRPCLTLPDLYPELSALDQRPKTTPLRLAPCQAMLRTPCSSHHLSHLLPTSNEMSRATSHTQRGYLPAAHTHTCAQQKKNKSSKQNGKTKKNNFAHLSTCVKPLVIQPSEYDARYVRMLNFVSFQVGDLPRVAGHGWKISCDPGMYKIIANHQINYPP